MCKSQLIFIAIAFCFCFGASASVLQPFKLNNEQQTLLKQKAEEGNPQAQYELASFYATEKPVDYPKIVLWLRRAAVQGHLESQFALGHIYQFGKPKIVPDLLEAEKWYEKAAKQGDKQALQALEVLRDRQAYRILSAPSIDDRWDVQWTAKTASYGDKQSQFELGQLYANGTKIQMDYVKAAEWYEKAAVQGHLEAMCALGALYLEGKGVSADTQKALFWYEQAALRDYTPAQHKLFEIYSGATDLKPDLVKAAGWLYVSLSYLFPNERDLVAVSPELKKIWDTLTNKQKEQVLYFAYSFIDEKRVRK